MALVALVMMEWRNSDMVITMGGHSNYDGSGDGKVMVVVVVVVVVMMGVAIVKYGHYHGWW